MRFHAIGRGGSEPKCYRCGTRELAYQYEGNGGDVYRCVACGYRSVHRNRVAPVLGITEPVCGIEPFGRPDRWEPCAFHAVSSSAPVLAE
jgi:hypothetical protein